MPGPGDPDGKGTFKGTIKDGEVCFKLHVRKVHAITSVAISAGSTGETGDVLVSLEPTVRGARGCTTIVPDEEDTEQTLSESEAAALADDPGGSYVEVASKKFPDGAVRGQLK